MSQRDEVVSFLANRAGAELTDILREAFAQRPEPARVGDSSEAVLAFAIVDRERGDDGVWSPWTISLIAAPDMNVYDESWRHGNGEPYLQFGECSECRVQLASHAKHAICPLCGCSACLT